MGPLFIPKHDPQTPHHDEDSHHHHHHHHHRSTPEGQEPEQQREEEEAQPKKYKNKQQQHRFSFTEYSNNSALRKYVVLLQDCAAIRFVQDRKQHTRPTTTSITMPRDFTTHSCSEWKQSSDGKSLFNSFISCNKSCYWNPLLLEAINSLEYKGCVHPSTILVCTTAHHMGVLRNAWSRRIVRDPPGYRAEFLGEVEELVAQPVQQGQFAPLSDSLCWVIADITSEGREAFINSIQWSLNHAFPCISPPPKDLIFQTLEKLIREQKIYQTPRGYFIINKDVREFIEYSRSVTPANIYGGGRAHSGDHLSISTPWGSTPSILAAHYHHQQENLMSSRTLNAGGGVRRHNSLRIVSSSGTRHDSFVNNNPSMGTRSLSFRLSKCNSLFESDKESDDNESVESNKVLQKNNTPPPPLPQSPKRDKKPNSSSSFFTRLFTFRCTSKRKTVQVVQAPSSSSSTSDPTNNNTPPKTNPPRRQRVSRRRVRDQRRSTSPSSSASGIYASITNSNVTKRSSSSSSRGASMYELRNWENKHENSDDVSR